LSSIRKKMGVGSRRSRRFPASRLTALAKSKAESKAEAMALRVIAEREKTTMSHVQFAVA
jgi:hypothetical protein